MGLGRTCRARGAAKPEFLSVLADAAFVAFVLFLGYMVVLCSQPPGVPADADGAQMLRERVVLAHVYRTAPLVLLLQCLVLSGRRAGPGRAVRHMVDAVVRVGVCAVYGVWGGALAFMLIPLPGFLVIFGLGGLALYGPGGLIAFAWRRISGQWPPSWAVGLVCALSLAPLVGRLDWHTFEAVLAGTSRVTRSEVPFAVFLAGLGFVTGVALWSTLGTLQKGRGSVPP